MYFNARYYDLELGIFISPDTMVPDPTALIDYNRYLYSRANPMRFNDPTGHQAACMADAKNKLTCNGNATATAQTVTSNVQVPTVQAPPPSLPSPTFIGAGDGCFYGCTTGVVLTYIIPGDIAGKYETAISPDMGASIPAPLIGQIDADAQMVIIYTTDGQPYIAKKASVTAGEGLIIGYEYSLSEGKGSPLIGLGFGDAGIQAQLWGGEGELNIGANGNSIGITGKLPQFLTVITSGQAIQNAGGVNDFSRTYAKEGYQLQSTELVWGNGNYTGVQILSAQLAFNARPQPDRYR